MPGKNENSSLSTEVLTQESLSTEAIAKEDVSVFKDFKKKNTTRMNVDLLTLNYLNFSTYKKKYPKRFDTNFTPKGLDFRLVLLYS